MLMLVDTAVALLPYTIAKFNSSIKQLLDFTLHTPYAFECLLVFAHWIWISNIRRLKVTFPKWCTNYK